mgnify:CR=1 FL=1
MPEKKLKGFQKGQIGNPNGRSKGSKNKVTLLREAVKQGAEDLMIKELPKIIEVVIKQAQGGDLTAAKMILDRTIPVIKAYEDKPNLGGGSINIIIGSLDAPVHIEGELDDGADLKG